MEELQRLGKGDGDAQPLASALDGKLGGRGLDDPVDRRFMGMPEHRKQRNSFAMIDGVITPYAAGDLAAV